MTASPLSPRLLKGALVSLDITSPIPQVIVFPIQPGHAHAAAQGARRAGRRGKGDATRLNGRAGGDDQDRRRDRRDRSAREGEGIARDCRHLSAAFRARDARLSRRARWSSPTQRCWRPGSIEIAAADRAVHALHLGREAHPAGAGRGIQHYRGGARHRAQSDPRQGLVSGCAC